MIMRINRCIQRYIYFCFNVVMDKRLCPAGPLACLCLCFCLSSSSSYQKAFPLIVWKKQLLLTLVSYYNYYPYWAKCCFCHAKLSPKQQSDTPFLLLIRLLVRTVNTISGYKSFIGRKTRRCAAGKTSVNYQIFKLSSNLLVWPPQGLSASRRQMGLNWASCNSSQSGYSCGHCLATFPQC